jgi:hypothetical protein
MVVLVRKSPNGVYAVRPFFRTFNLLNEVEEMARTAFENSLGPRMDMYEEDKQVIIKASRRKTSTSALRTTLSPSRQRRRKRKKKGRRAPPIIPAKGASGSTSAG